MEEKCQSIVNLLKSKGINFVCIDFDQTIVSHHTYGRWTGTVEDLEAKMRPFFRKFIPMLHKNGLMIAVVTFSIQVQLISQLLKMAFPDFSEEITIRGEDKSWEYKGKGSKVGKQSHMASAAEEVGKRTGVEISRSSTILIDDDGKNIEFALENKTPAVWFDISSPDSFPEDLYAFLTKINLI